MFLLRKILTSIIGGVIVLFLLFYVIFLPLFSFIPNRPVPEAHKDKPKVIIVDRDKQLLFAYEKGELKFKFLAITGMTGLPTPLGDFKVGWKNIDHVSSETVGAPMPYSMFFVPKRGIAIHGSQAIPYRWRLNELSPGAPAGSHGCVSLTKRNAGKLFEWGDLGTPVIVIGTDPPPDAPPVAKEPANG